jgi:hypothetical protein
MAKRYLSLDEAAALLSMAPDELMRLRERGDIRGFADRGSWKFREQDVEEFARSRGADSSPDFPIIRDDESSSVLDEPEADMSSSDSDVRLFFDESLFGDDDAKKVADSGSDVQLTGDSGPQLESEADEDALDFSGWDEGGKLSDSDSDVKLVGAPTDGEIDLSKTTMMSDSDSDVLLAGDTEDDSGIALMDSDSDVRLSDDDSGKTVELTLAAADSDSDVKLMGSDDLLGEEIDSDSDVKLSAGLDRTDSDIRLAESTPAPDARTIALPAIPDDSDLKLINKGSGIRLPIDSGINLNARGSGLSLDAEESGISLEIDSGISLDADDSGISLESFDSGAKLGADDSGLSLDADDSGISLDLDDDSGISLDADDDDDQDMSRTMPMQAIPGARAMLNSTGATTQLEMPSRGAGNDSEFELAGLDDDDDDMDTSTSVLKFEDDDDAEGGGTSTAVDDDYEESYDDEAGMDDDFAEDELDDVHDAEDFDEDDDFGTGGGGVSGFPQRAAVRADVDWGTPVKVMLGISTLLSLVCAVVGIELVRTMWLFTQPDAQPSGILEAIGGMF